MLATSLMDKDKPHDEVITASDAALHSLLQQDRILAAVKEEARYLKGATAQRAHEVEALRAELNTASAQEYKQKKVLDDQIQTVGSSICASDRGRRVAAQGVYDEEQQAISVRRSFSYSFQTRILNWFSFLFLQNLDVKKRFQKCCMLSLWVRASYCKVLLLQGSSNQDIYFC
jgi:hypothetical protein